MATNEETSKHDVIKAEIFSACKDMNFNAVQEYRGHGWRADVFASKGENRFAFEIQISPQSLKKTLERQAKYTDQGIIGCWLFENRPSKLTDERPDLPLFYVSEQTDKSFAVSLSGRKELPLHIFLERFLSGDIKFCNVARALPKQHIKLVFYEMPCWKCKAMNHIYYVDAIFHSACNAVIRPEEALWASNQKEYRPEIIAMAKDYCASPQGRHLKLGEVKKRYSKTVEDSYTSFGCYKCDSIFGDFFVMEAQMEAAYGYGQVGVTEGDIFLENIELPIPHWCFPDGLPFCDSPS